MWAAGALSWKLREARLHANEPQQHITSTWQPETPALLVTCGRLKSPERPQAILSLWVWIQHKYIQIKFEKLWYPLLPFKFISSLFRKQISTSLWLHLLKSIYPFLNSSNAEVWNRFTLSKGSNFCILFAICTHFGIVKRAVHWAHKTRALLLFCLLYLIFLPWAWV